MLRRGRGDDCVLAGQTFFRRPTTPNIEGIATAVPSRNRTPTLDSGPRHRTPDPVGGGGGGGAGGSANRPPVIENEIGPQRVVAGGSTTIDLAQAFYDRDQRCSTTT